MIDIDNLLQEAISSGIINIESIKYTLEMKKHQEFLDNHPYKIWLGKNGEWNTYIMDDVKGKVRKHRKTKEEIEKIIIEYWKSKEENPTIKELYDEWVNQKLERNEILITTKNRYDRQYDECMKEFGMQKIRSITPLDVDDFMCDAVVRNKLTAKGFANLRTIVKGIFKKAKKKKYIDWSISYVMSDLDISQKAFRKVRHSDEELIFMEDDILRIEPYFRHDNDLIDLGILLLFKTGLRPGELAGLMKQDITNNVIHVNRTEIQYLDEDGKYFVVVRDFPKTDAGIRNVIVPEESMWIIEEIYNLNKDGKFLFEERGKRIKYDAFARRIRKICTERGIVPKSLNKIRKTYGTILIDADVEESLIISQMGHTDIETTKQFYYKNRKNMKQKESVINKVFDNKVGA